MWGEHARLRPEAVECSRTRHGDRPSATLLPCVPSEARWRPARVTELLLRLVLIA